MYEYVEYQLDSKCTQLYLYMYMQIWWPCHNALVHNIPSNIRKTAQISKIYRYMYMEHTCILLQVHVTVHKHYMGIT